MNTSLLVLIFVATSLALVLGRENQLFLDYIRPHVQTCGDAMGASDEDKNAVQEYQELETKSQMCLLYCVYHEIGVQDGITLGPEDIEREFHDEDREDLVKKCRKEAEMKGQETGDECLMANARRRCFRKAYEES